ncbi:TRAP transporter small permease [Natroniella sp. ANB-PHB2]|uniref:TRAP transporter small permease n=1 Tax=Natroniella sp. ANB-PHB2 TaxID=3384444 RepID=UPI0038D389F5
MMGLLVFLVGIVFTNIVSRRFFGGSLVWVDEVSRLLFVWISLIAMAIGFRKSSHPSFSVLLEKLDEEKAKKLLIVINILILIFLFYLLQGGIDYALRSQVQRTSILEISVAWKYAAVPVATAIMFIECIIKTINLFKKDELKIEHETNEVI